MILVLKVDTDLPKNDNQDDPRSSVLEIETTTPRLLSYEISKNQETSPDFETQRPRHQTTGFWVILELTAEFFPRAHQTQRGGEALYLHAMRNAKIKF